MYSYCHTVHSKYTRLVQHWEQHRNYNTIQLATQNSKHIEYISSETLVQLVLNILIALKMNEENDAEK